MHRPPWTQSPLPPARTLAEAPSRPHLAPSTLALLQSSMRRQYSGKIQSNDAHTPEWLHPSEAEPDNLPTSLIPSSHRVTVQPAAAAESCQAVHRDPLVMTTSSVCLLSLCPTHWLELKLREGWDLRIFYFISTHGRWRLEFRASLGYRNSCLKTPRNQQLLRHPDPGWPIVPANEGLRAVSQSLCVSISQHASEQEVNRSLSPRDEATVTPQLKELVTHMFVLLSLHTPVSLWGKYTARVISHSCNTWLW